MVKRKNISEQKYPSPEDLTINTKSTTKEKAEVLKDAILLQGGNISSNPKTFPSWKSQNKILDEYSINPPGTAWMKLVIAEKKSTRKKYLRLRRFGQQFNIPSQEYLASMTKAMFEGSKEIGWKKSQESQMLSFLQRISSLKNDKVKYAQKIKELLTKLDEIRIAQLNADLPRFKRDLKRFEKLIKGKHKEQDIQDFLEKNTWLFGGEYLEKQPEYCYQYGLSDSRFDFMLQRYDTFYDIIEIKKADVPLLNTRHKNAEPIPSRRTPFSADLKNVISQMIGYLELVDEKKHELRKKRIFIHKPKGKIVIGRTLNAREQKAIKTISSYLNQIEIMTYDDLLKRGQNFVETIYSRRKN